MYLALDLVIDDFIVLKFYNKNTEKNVIEDEMNILKVILDCI